MHSSSLLTQMNERQTPSGGLVPQRRQTFLPAGQLGSTKVGAQVQPQVKPGVLQVLAG
jgi:hypothetical protein